MCELLHDYYTSHSDWYKQRKIWGLIETKLR